MRAVIMCRVSSREQEEEGYSLPAQESVLQEYRVKKEFTKDETFSFAESASGAKQRKDFDAMMAYLRKENIKILICEKVDRVTRNQTDAVVVNKWLNEDEERQVHLVKENVVLSKNSTSHEKFIWNIKVSVAQYYTDNLSEEVRKGQKEMCAQGRWPTEPPPGYMMIGEDGHRVVVPDPKKSFLVIRMFELYDSGQYSLPRLTDKIYEEGLRNRNNNKIVTSRIHELLQDPFYIGKMRWNRVVHDGQHVPIITDELFERVQNRMKRKNTPKYSKHYHLFQSLVICGCCGGPITWEIGKGKTRGHCNHYRPCTQTDWIREDDTEVQIKVDLEKLKILNPRVVAWIHKALLEGHKEEVDHYSSNIEELQTQLKVLDNRMDKLYDDKADGAITLEFHDRKFKQYSDEKEALLSLIGKHSKAHQAYHDIGIRLFELSQKALQIYNGTKESNDKRDLISLVFAQLILDGKEIKKVHTRAFQVLSKLIAALKGTKLKDLEEFEKIIFGPEKIGSEKQKDQPFGVGLPTWLPG